MSVSEHNVSPIEHDQVAGTSTNQHTTKQAGAEVTVAAATAAPAPAPAPSEPPPPTGAAATAATRYRGNTGGTNKCKGRVGSTNEHRRVQTSVRGYKQVWGGMNKHSRV